MKINPINNPNILKSYAKSQSYAPQGKPVTSGKDEVTFSKEALSFSKTLAEVREAMPQQTPPAERQAKLDELAEKIRTGQYQVDSGDVADKLVADILGRYQD